MAKVFEDYFSAIHADMVSICLEYVEDHADVIYIYCSSEDGAMACQYFYKINGKIVKKHKLNDVANKDITYDVSIERQKAVLDILTEDIKKMMILCKDYERDMPTEIKLVYNVPRNSLEAKYRYDLVFSNDIDKTGYQVFNDWFNEVSSKSEAD
jgi:hypothetical protein